MRRRALIHRPPEPISYLFVDGSYLTYVLDGYRDRLGVDFEFDYRALSMDHRKTFYFDSPQGTNDQKVQESYLAENSQFWNSLRRIDGFHVLTGEIKKDRKGRGFIQKRVDVMLTVQMMSHMMKGNMQKCALLAGDSDFVPLVEALVAEGLDIEVISQSKSCSVDLINAADIRSNIDIFWLKKLLSGGQLKSTILKSERQNLPQAPHKPVTVGQEPIEYKIYCINGTYYGYVKSLGKADWIRVESTNPKVMGIALEEVHGVKVDSKMLE